jgi:hypothetical protein
MLRWKPAHAAFARFPGLLQFSSKFSAVGSEGVERGERRRDIAIEMLDPRRREVEP